MVELRQNAARVLRRIANGERLVLSHRGKPAARLEREVRAYAGWPRSRATIGQKEVVVTAVHTAEGVGKVGELFLESKQLGFYTSNGILIIDSLIPAGKKEMPATAFLAGYLK